MNKQYAKKLLADFIKGRCSEEETAEIRRMVDADPYLRREYEWLQRYFDALEGVEPVQAPEGFLKRVHERTDRPSILRRLFFSLHTKIPLELAGLGATLAVVVLLLKPFDYPRIPPLELDETMESLSEPIVESMPAPDSDMPAAGREFLEPGSERGDQAHQKHELKKSVRSAQSQAKSQQEKSGEKVGRRAGRAKSISQSSDRTTLRKSRPEASLGISTPTEQEDLADGSGLPVDRDEVGRLSAPKTGMGAGSSGTALRAEPEKPQQQLRTNMPRSRYSRKRSKAAPQKEASPAPPPASPDKEKPADVLGHPFNEEFAQYLDTPQPFEPTDEKPQGSVRSRKQSTAKEGESFFIADEIRPAADSTGPGFTDFEKQMFTTIDSLLQQYQGRYQREEEQTSDSALAVYMVHMPSARYPAFRDALAQSPRVPVSRTVVSSVDDETVTFRLMISREQR